VRGDCGGEAADQYQFAVYRVLLTLAQPTAMKGGSISPHLATGECIHLYGWNSRTEIWHDPAELRGNGLDRRILGTLRAMSGKSWYGSVNYCVETLCRAE
jgi:hypothetical protein